MNWINDILHSIQQDSVFEAARGRQGLVSAEDPCNAPGGKSLSERVAHALLPKPKPNLSISIPKACANLSLHYLNLNSKELREEHSIY